MTERFLSYTEVAQQVGVTTGALASAHLPPADAITGKTRGWRPETIQAWAASRPGKGRWGERPRKDPDGRDTPTAGG